MLLFDIEMVKRYKDKVIQVMGDYFSWNTEQENSCRKELDTAISQAAPTKK